MKYQIINQYGHVRSTHKTLEAAQKQRHRDLDYRCGICGVKRAGWRKCKHGTQSQVCNADRYGDKIIEAE